MFPNNKVNGVKLVRFIALSLILSLFLLNLSNINIHQVNNQKDNNVYHHINENLEDLRISDYSSSHEGIGGEINISLHQSLIDTTTTSIMNTSDPTNNTFDVACPTDSDFNSTYTYIEVENIVSHNKTLVIEEPNNINNGSDEFSQGKVKATSFKIDQDAYLENVSVYITSLKNKFCEFLVVLFNTSWIGGQTEPNGGENEYHVVLGKFNYTADKSTDYVGWFNCRNLHYYLNNSKTDNNTWCVGLVETDNSDPASNPKWFYVPDSVNGDNSLSYTISGNTWTLFNPGDFVDMMTMLTFNKASMFPVADLAEVGLKINGTAVNGIGGTGTWNSTGKIGTSSGNLKFRVTADWDSLECDITLVQINFTKTNLKAASSFNMLGSGQDILWNVSPINGLNFFDSRLIRNRINFTIPITWYNINVFNGSINKTDDISSYSLNNGFKIIHVLNAGNGSNWYLNASSTNLVQSLDTLIGSTPVNTVNFTEIVNFNVTFSKTIAQNDGTINLSIYSPAAISDKLNYTTAKSTFNEGLEFSLASWDISENVTQCGIFRIQVFWNNNTAAGFLEKALTIVGSTELTIIDPPNNSFYNPADIFNITLYFNDTGADQGIDGADIDIEVNGSSYTTDTWDIQNGNYKIKINCSDSEFSTLGWYEITINISKQFYYNQSEILTIKIITATTPKVTIETPSDGSTFDNTDNIEINATITDQDGFISNAKVMINASAPFNISMSFISGKWTCIWDNTSEYAIGDYKITIWAIDDDGNINQSEYVDIIINDVISPHVIIEEPSHGSIFNNTANVEINATVIEKGGFVSKVKAMINASTSFNISMSLLNGKWTCTWNNISEYEIGDYKITIWATDDNGNINQTESVVITINDAINPNVIFEEPTNGSSHDNIVNIVINATVTDIGSSISSVKAMINATIPFNITMKYIAGKWTCIWNNVSEYSVGNYNITIWAIDNNGNINQTEFVIITLNDVINPNVVIETPADGSTHDNTASFDINATITDIGSTISSVKAMINATIPFNMTMNYIVGKWTCTWSNLSLYDASDYKITIWAMDEYGNINQTEFIITTINDVINPNVVIETPSDGSTHDNIANIEINATITDIGSSVSNAIAMINGTIPFNITMNYISGKWTCSWINLSLYDARDYKIGVWAIDEYGNINQTEFIVITLNDVNNPNVVINLPSDGSTHDNIVNIEINATITDIGSSVSKAIAMINTTSPLNISMNYVTGKWTCIWDNLSLYDAGDYKITIWAMDEYGNINQTEFIIITLNDVIIPSVIIENPSDGSSFNKFQNIEINTTINEIGSGVNSAKAMINATIPFNITMNYIAGKWTCTWSNISLYDARDYKITIWAIDEYGNINQTEFVIITITDEKPPSVIIDNPSDGSFHDNTASMEINATITDDGSVSSAKAMINATIPINITMNYIAGKWTCVWNNLSLYEASNYKITIWSIDDKGNINQTESIIITLNDVINPSVFIDSPSNGNKHDNTANIEINATITDIGSSVSNALVMINSSIPLNISLQYILGKWTCIWDNLSFYEAGDYKITIWAIDTHGNINQTEFIIITINDVINPSVVIETPSDGSSHDNNVNIVINATITDDSSVINVKAMINASTPFNLSMSYIVGTWTCQWDNVSGYTIENYKITIWAIDENGNINQTEFIIISINDAINPNVIIEEPSDGSSHNNIVNIEINATITDKNSLVLAAKAMINTSTPLNITMQFIGGIWTCSWDNTSFYSAGNYKITIWAIDDKGNVNQTEYVVISLIDVINPSVIIMTPSNWDSFNNSNIIEINATITDIGSSITDVKAMINASTPLNITMLFIENMWTCTWDNTSEYNAGDYKITIWAIDEYGNINQTEEINLKLFGLTSLNIVNLTEYNLIISLNGTTYEAYAGQNITIYANFVCLYPYSLIKGAVGILIFNGIYYYDNDLDNDGLYSWEINTSQLVVNNYEFNVSFSKIFYQNITSKIKFDINKLLTQITITDQPSTVICGNDCNLTIRLDNLLTSDFIINKNVTLLLDFGVLQANITAKTSAFGTLTYNISIPVNATKFDFIVRFLGSEIYTASEVVSSVTIIINGIGGGGGGGGGSETGDKPEEPDPDLLVISILLLLGIIAFGSITGYVIVTKRKTLEKRILLIRNDKQEELKLINEVLDKFNLNYEVIELSNLLDITEIDNSRLIIIIGLLYNRTIDTEQSNEQKTLIRRALRKKIPIIGVGAGIQILAEYLGDNLISYPIDEIGFKHKKTWYTVKLANDSSDDKIFKMINDNFFIFQFYNKRFEISEGLANLGKTQSWKNQIIRFGDGLYGFQIHFELSKYLVNHFLDFAPELNDYDWNRLKFDYNQLIESYYQRGKNLFIDYLKLIKLIRDIEFEKTQQVKINKSEKNLDNLIKHIDIKTKKSEHAKFTATNLEELKKKIDSRIKKI